MQRDPIVCEVRKAGEELAKQANYNLHTFFQNLRNNQRKRISELEFVNQDKINYPSIREIKDR